MWKTLRFKTKSTGVQISSPQKNLRPVIDNKENFLDMGRHKTEEPDETSQKASKLKNPEKETLVPRRSKRRNALIDVVINTETSKEEQTSKCAKVKPKKRAAETKKASKTVTKKTGKTNLTQAKLNFSPTNLPITKEEQLIIGDGENADPQLDRTFCVSESLYQEVETPPSSAVDNTPFGELLKAAKQDDKYELKNPTVQVSIQNKEPFEEVNDLTYDELFKTVKKDDTYELQNPTAEVLIQSQKVFKEEVNMLTSTTPPDGYWKELAEQRRIALEKTLYENESLHDQIEVLQVENAQLRNIVQQAEELASVVKGIL